MAEQVQQVSVTETTLTTAATDVSGLSATDTEVAARSYTITNPSTTITLYFRIGTGAWVPVVANLAGDSYVTERAAYGEFLMLGGADEYVQWKAASGTISGPTFTYLKRT